MTALSITLLIATFLCALVAGLLFAFAVVIMPGIAKLPDRAFIRAFQVMDRVIQDSQPLFMVAWVGSVLALLAAAVLAFGTAAPVRWLAIGALAAYLVGVQLPTGVINVPLNNRLQTLDTEAVDEAALRGAREEFEGRWNASNRFRTVVACLVVIALMVGLTAM